MLFNSYVFWVFFIAVVAVYWRLGHRLQNRFLLVASYVFYAAWNWRFLSLIWISTIVDYVAARGIAGSDSPRRRKALLALSACTNLTLLGVKREAAVALRLRHAPGNPWALFAAVILVLGIVLMWRRFL